MKKNMIPQILVIIVTLIAMQIPIKTYLVSAEKDKTSNNLGEIAFIIDENIWTVNSDGSNLNQITTEGGYSEPEWSKDGRFIAYIHKFIAQDNQEYAWEIGRLNINTNEKEILVPAEKTPFILIDDYYLYFNPRWSPDDRYLYYISSDGRVQGDFVHRVEISTGKIDEGFSTFSVVHAIDVSPSDGAIIFTNFFNAGPVGHTLNKANPNGIPISILVPIVDGSNISTPRVSPDGGKVAYFRGYIGSSSSIDILNLVTDEKDSFLFNESITRIFWSSDGNKIIYQSNGELQFLDVTSGSKSYFHTGSDPSWNWSQNSGVDLAFLGPLDISNKQKPFLPDNITIESYIKNQNPSESITDVIVKYYDGDPNDGGVLIGSVEVGDLGPGENKTAQFNWKINGNLENHKLFAETFSTSGVQDPNPTNNKISQTFSVYYVDFRHDEDAYSFFNRDVGKITVLDIEEFFADSYLPQEFYSLLLPFFLIVSENQGWCYGLSNSSIAFFFHPYLKPNPALTTYDHTIALSRSKIYTYHWFGMGPFIRSIINPPDLNKQYNDTLNHIKKGEPVIHGLFDRSGIFGSIKQGTHAVVAYKIIEIRDEKRVYYYDNNAPLSFFPDGFEEPYGVFTSNGYTFPIYTKSVANPLYYNNAYPYEYSLTPSDNIRNLLIRLAGWLLTSIFQNGQIVFTYEGKNAYLIAEDSIGRLAGYQSGQEINEIPGAIVTHIDGSQSIFLPTNQNYNIRLINTGITSLSNTNSPSTLHVVDPINAFSAQIYVFKDISILQDETAELEFSHGITNLKIKLPDGSYFSPDVDEVLISSNLIHLPLIEYGP